jgi:hypothetical protein
MNFKFLQYDHGYHNGMEHLTSENCKRDKRNYTKSTNEYWSDIIFKQRAADKAKIFEEMSLVADKYSENDPVPCSIDRDYFRVYFLSYEFQI